VRYHGVVHGETGEKGFIFPQGSLVTYEGKQWTVDDTGTSGTAYLKCNNSVCGTIPKGKAMSVNERYEDRLEAVARVLLSQMWIGAELGAGNSSLRGYTEDEYFKSNKGEWLNKAKAVIDYVESHHPTPSTQSAEDAKQGATEYVEQAAADDFKKRGLSPRVMNEEDWMYVYRRIAVALRAELEYVKKVNEDWKPHLTKSVEIHNHLTSAGIKDASKLMEFVDAINELVGYEHRIFYKDSMDVDDGLFAQIANALAALTKEPTT